LLAALNQSGFLSVFVEWGGEVRVSGRHPQGRPWQVYIANYNDPKMGKALAVVALENAALATSGDYLQQWSLPQGCLLPRIFSISPSFTRSSASSQKAITFFHLFNAHQLCPYRITDSSIASVTVKAADCMTADALASILLASTCRKEAEALACRLRLQGLLQECWIFTHDIACASIMMAE
jgi:thiamine biosynthesis lipoprotein